MSNAIKGILSILFGLFLAANLIAYTIGVEAGDTHDKSDFGEVWTLVMPGYYLGYYTLPTMRMKVF